MNTTRSKRTHGNYLTAATTTAIIQATVVKIPYGEIVRREGSTSATSWRGRVGRSSAAARMGAGNQPVGASSRSTRTASAALSARRDQGVSGRRLNA